jgi:hypothetical protein
LLNSSLRYGCHSSFFTQQADPRMEAFPRIVTRRLQLIQGGDPWSPITPGNEVSDPLAEAFEHPGRSVRGSQARHRGVFR